MSGLRLALLCTAPLLTLLLSPSGLLLASTCGSSLVAVGLDLLRQKRRCLPFPIYLPLVYALQIYTLLALPGDSGGAGLEGVRHEVAEEVALASPDAPTTPSPSIKTMSVVMVAYNEHKYLSRTVESVYNFTPNSVLKEIIVVDDASDPPLAEELMAFPQVKVLRHESHRGLVKSRADGGNLATSDMIMFLDAHVKPEPDWWTPILRHMNTNYKRLVVPVIPNLDGDTWQPEWDGVGTKMMFDWGLLFTWFEDHNDLVPCMSGGLYGITRRWWHESGEYDYGMGMWGSENIEQSIRVWLCGGEIYVARDSTVSHVFREAQERPYLSNWTDVTLNKVRTVEAWFDEYKENFYRAEPDARKYVSAVGDLSERLALKRRLKCKPFKWYIEKFEKVFAAKRMLPEDVFLLRDKKTNRCLDVSMVNLQIHEAECNPDSSAQHWCERDGGRSFRFALREYCLDANATMVGRQVLLKPCATGKETQAWKLQEGQIRWHGYCLRGRGNGKALTVMDCPESSLRGSGDFEMYARRNVTRRGLI